MNFKITKRKMSGWNYTYNGVFGTIVKGERKEMIFGRVLKSEDRGGLYPLITAEVVIIDPQNENQRAEARKLLGIENPEKRYERCKVIY